MPVPILYNGGKMADMERLTVKDIYARYPSEWVFLTDPEVTTTLEVLSGNVAAHSTDRDEVYQAAATIRPKHSAFLYTGTIPKDVIIIL